MQFRKTLIQLFALTSLLIAGGAYAHTDEYLDTQKAPHGGQLRMAGIYHFELVVAKDSKQSKNNPVVVYVTDHAGTKISTTGAKGTVTLLAGKTKTMLNLTPDSENALKASGNYTPVPEMKAVVSITLAGKAAEQARFTPLSNSGTAKLDDHAGHAEH
ncbi:hypothetical protein Undi14_17920 [Undibacterium sp. 14-3-2]|uniref:hypothetical protein n=1 Tax=Undibacterium sp. 14-3-2 TaxID=2800129 RepID=UPI001904DE2C|nr:hypothetical protein [Undibacterium sp. 14-3-2]MBK1891913.1 hypothetical protein [Undibacterium sp. 14-3-2]